MRSMAKAVDTPHVPLGGGYGIVDGEIHYSAAWREYADHLYCSHCGYVIPWLWVRECPQCMSPIEEEIE